MTRPLFPRALRIALALLVLLSALAVPLPASAASTSVREDLNLRSGPGLGYRVLTVMPASATVTLDGDPTEGWYPHTPSEVP